MGKGEFRPVVIRTDGQTGPLGTIYTFFYGASSCPIIISRLLKSATEHESGINAVCMTHALLRFSLMYTMHLTFRPTEEKEKRILVAKCSKQLQQSGIIGRS